MKKFVFSLIFGLFLTVSVHAQVQQPDCIVTVTFTTTGRAVYDNRGFVTPVCTTWHLAYFNEGFSALSIELDEAPSSGGAPGTWVTWPNLASGTLPLSATTQGQITAYKYFPWVSINVTSVTGTGTLRAAAYGYRPVFLNDASAAASAVTNTGCGASGSPPACAPVLIAGTDQTNAQTIKTGTNGVIATIVNTTGTDGFSNTSVGGPTSPASAAGQLLLNAPFWFNGATWDRQFYCNKTTFQAAITATTVQLVAAVAGAKIRVCSIVIERNDVTGVATTVKLVEGTGAACVTGQTSLTGSLFTSGTTAVTADSPPALLTGPFVTNVAADALCAQTTGAASSFDVTIVYEQH